jgi:pimeloyl-ACP methyl ester carboxylesterase
MWGEADRFLPFRHGPRAVALLPDAIFHSLPGVGHSPNWEAPAAVLNAIGGFLDFP